MVSKFPLQPCRSEEAADKGLNSHRQMVSLGKLINTSRCGFAAKLRRMFVSDVIDLVRKTGMLLSHLARGVKQISKMSLHCSTIAARDERERYRRRLPL